MRELQYAELRQLVTACTPDDARRYDLEGLLDHFARTALVYQQNLDALELATCNEPIALSTRRRAICERRLAVREACMQAAARLDDELETIDGVVRLIVQRSVIPPIDPEIEYEVDRRLADLDAIDGVRGELADPDAWSRENR